jgi:DNA-binding LacI/PurR family transcriptional regulator
VDELGYRPNAAARTLVRRRSGAIGVLVTNLENPFYADVLAGIDAVACTRDYTLLVLGGGRSAETDSSALEKLLELRVEGVVCAAANVPAKALAAAGRATPIVSLTRRPAVPRVDTVVNDDVAGARMVVEHLHSLGHRHIAMIDGTQERAGLDRRRGYEDAMTAAGLADGIHIVDGGYTEPGGHEATRRLLTARPRPTAIFAATDLSALGALDALDGAGVRVPDEVSVVGYDNTWIAQLRRISLTTIEQPRQEIGTAAMQALLDRIDDPDRPARRMVIQPALVARMTSGPATPPRTR